VIEQFAKLVLDALREDITNYSADAAAGRCKSFEEYQHLTGRIQGLRQAEAYLLSLLEKVQKQDDDD
jgi:hypothetical protein